MKAVMIFLSLFSLLMCTSLQGQVEPHSDNRRVRKVPPNMPSDNETVDAESYNKLNCDYLYNEKENEEFEKYYQSFIKNQTYSKSAGTIYSIPTVIHIFHSGEPVGYEENPNDNNVRSVIELANQNFRHTRRNSKSYTNPYYGIDTEIELCFVRINRYNNYSIANNSSGPSSSSVGSYLWDPARYLNIVITTESSRCGGYGYFGSGGVDIKASCWGPGLISHEVGHYLNLGHIWSSNGSCSNNNCLQDGDRVCDTPVKYVNGYSSSSSCGDIYNSCTSDDDDLSSNNPYRPTSYGGLGDQPDMYENYMDYTGSCWDSYTLGQKNRMRASIIANRSGMLVNSCSSYSGSNNVNGCSTMNSNTNGSSGYTGTLVELFSTYNPIASNQIAQVCVTAEGDVGNTSEYFYVSTETQYRIVETNVSPSDCVKSSPRCFEVNATIFNDWIEDDVMQFYFTPSSTLISPYQCSNNGVCVEVRILNGDTAPNLVCNNTGTLSISNNTLTISDVSVKNIGGTSSGSSILGYYLSTNNYISTSDYLIGTDFVSSLTTNGVSTESIIVNVPSSVPNGTYYVGLLIDKDGEVAESDESDNRCFINSPLFTKSSSGTPNLTAVLNQSLVINNDVITINNLSIINNGSSIANNFRVGYYLSTNTTFNSVDFLVGIESVSSLLANSSTDINKSINIPNSIPEGTYYVGVIVDNESVISELSEVDNFAYYSSPRYSKTNANTDPNCTNTIHHLSGYNAYFGTSAWNAKNYIKLSNSILRLNSPDKLIFRAGNYIELNGTFEIKKGAEFTAEIGDCKN